MLRSRFILASLGFAALALAACGNAADGTGGAGGGGAGGTGGGGGVTVDLVHPPEKNPDAPAAASMQKPTLAMRTLTLGSGKAWETLGYDLDNKASTADSKDLCKPAEGAKPSAVYEDGEGGIDNSFGKNILPIIESLASDAQAQINNSIENGSFSILIRLDELGANPDENGIKSKLYAGAQFVDAMGVEAVPTWNGTDAWPVVDELLNNSDIETPKVQFPESYVVTDATSGARTWVSGDFGTITLNLSIAGFTLSLTIDHALISMDLDAENTKGTNGKIAGILKTEQLISELAKVAGSFDPSLCPPSSTFESIAQQIRQASDIGSDGAQDPAKTCDGISIGLGFEMQQALIGSVAPPATPGDDPCMMP